MKSACLLLILALMLGPAWAVPPFKVRMMSVLVPQSTTSLATIGKRLPLVLGATGLPLGPPIDGPGTCSLEGPQGVLKVLETRDTEFGAYPLGWGFSDFVDWKQDQQSFTAPFGFRFVCDVLGYQSDKNEFDTDIVWNSDDVFVGDDGKIQTRRASFRVRKAMLGNGQGIGLVVGSDNLRLARLRKLSAHADIKLGGRLSQLLGSAEGAPDSAAVEFVVLLKNP